MSDRGTEARERAPSGDQIAAAALRYETGERYHIGFFIDPDGMRTYDRLRLSRTPDGYTGELIRLAGRGATPVRYQVHTPDGKNGSGLDLALVPVDGGPPQRLRVGLQDDLAAGGAAFEGTLEGVGDDHPLPRLAYVLEDAPAVHLEPSPTHGWGVASIAAIEAGMVVAKVHGPFSDTQTPYSFRTSGDRHVEPTGYGHFVNHACEPSCRIVYDDDTRPCLVAVRDLAAGEEITFDYTATEGDLANAFTCLCAANTHKV